VTAISRALGTATFRLTLVYLLIFMIIAGAVIGYMFWRTNNLLTEQVMQTVGAEVKGLREQFNVGGVGLLKQTIDRRSLRPGNNLYLLTNPQGVRLAGNLSRVPPRLASKPAGGVFEYTRLGHDGAQQRVAVGTVFGVTGGALLIVARDIEDQRNFTAGSRRIFLWSFALLALVGVGGGLLISRHILGRIEKVNETAQTIMSGDLTGRIAITGADDELDRLSENLNRMLARIEQLMNGLKEVSDNIAHDLKTPLSRMRNRVEGALREGSSEGDYKEVLERTIEESDELIKTFNALLSIARLEAGAVVKSFEPVSLSEIIRDVGELYEPLVDDGGMRLQLHVEDGVDISGDRQLLGQSMANLFENALKYGVSEGCRDKTGGSMIADISVRLETVNGQARIIVSDRGPGIPECDRARALKRFVRLEDSRSKPGSGLGLSLVAAVARLHGGEVELEDANPGLRVVLSFPLKGKSAHNGSLVS